MQRAKHSPKRGGKKQKKKTQGCKKKKKKHPGMQKKSETILIKITTRSRISFILRWGPRLSPCSYRNRPLRTFAAPQSPHEFRRLYVFPHVPPIAAHPLSQGKKKSFAEISKVCFFLKRTTTLCVTLSRVRKKRSR